MEMIKQMLELLRGNADTGIGDFKVDIVRVVLIPFSHDRDNTVTGEFHRIADQVDQNLPQPHRIAQAALTQVVVKLGLQGIGMHMGLMLKQGE